MAAVKMEVYIALINAGVPEETAGKLAAADIKLDVEATLSAALEAIGKVRKWQQTLDDGVREAVAKDTAVRAALDLPALGGGERGWERSDKVAGSLPTMNVPNLDAMEPDELRRFGDVCMRLAQYASLKASALREREHGRVDDALRAETVLEQIYHLLPDEYRW
jgi:hypothetical protein